ncbi:MAG: cupredoxin domain-containing protein [Alphaproteobacteria bacterium]|nr:cupredoxin domain-containing protein [Alphaproteobacteria bacterium]
MVSITRRKFLSIFAATSVAASLLPNFISKALALNGKDRKTHQIKISNFEFEPTILNVEIGDVVIWMNIDIAPHTATARDKSWSTKTLKKGEQQEIIISKDMSLDYFCRFHPMMKATLTLKIRD